MKNKILEAQIRNAERFMQTLKQSCKLAAVEDDGKISLSERRVLVQIDKAADRFLKDIGKIKLDEE